MRSDLKGCGLGKLLMQKLIAYCRARGTHAIVGEALSENSALRRLVTDLGFIVLPFAEAGTRSLRMQLQNLPAPAPR